MKKKLIFIALPTKRYIEPECDEFISTKIFKPNDMYEIDDLCILRNSPNIYMQRYNLCKRFLKTNADYYLYLDTDQTVVTPDNPIQILMADDKDIISPLIVRSGFPHLPACMSFKQHLAFIAKEKYFEDYRKFPQDRPYQVYYCCGGIVLIKRKVLRQIDKPFLPVFNDEGELLSVDYAMYNKAKQHNFTCWIEPRIQAAHIGHFPFIIDDYYALLDTGQLDIEQDENGRNVFSMREQLK